MSRQQVPAIDGWFRDHMLGEAPAAPCLVGSRCTTCSTYFFPRVDTFCRNPHCSGRDFEEVPLSTRGRLWSWTTNHYPPPAPYVAPDPFVPYTIAAVELADEQMVVLGQLDPDIDPGVLTTGMEMQLTLGTLFSDADHDYTVWKWRPTEPATAPSAATQSPHSAQGHGQ
jgi:uncharacterized OB-fold protein